MKNDIFESALINFDEALHGILSLATNKSIYNHILLYFFSAVIANNVI